MQNRFPSEKPLRRAAALIALGLSLGAMSASALAQDGGDGQEGGGGMIFGLWEPFAPVQNPVTEEKRVLGKILFWDEQLSSDNTVSCGTCHIPSAGGSDPRPGVNPAYDGLFGTEDDVQGSQGVILSDPGGEYLRSVLFDLLPQTTPRRSISNLMSMYPGNLFWDGRAEGAFVDPVTGQTLAVSSAALEVQSLMPIVDTTEMAHQERDWPEVFEKLGASRPLALASDIPEDMAMAIEAHPSYPDLFEQAFGDPQIDAGRIAFAIATYQRTLVPDQSPWDIWNAGDPTGMTPEQQEGWATFRASTCNDCHVGPLFTNNNFTVNGVRPVEEDRGRADVSGTDLERGAFRMGSLRNLGTRDRFMHTGGLVTIDDVFDFYAHRNGQQPFEENLDFRLRTPIVFSPEDEALVKNFIMTALTDPRTVNEEFPFDRPTLYSEGDAPNPLVSGSGSAGTGGHVPAMIAVTPPNIGNLGFKIGVDYALGGADAWVAISSSPPTNGKVSQDTLIGPISLSGMSAGDGYGTLIYPIADPSLEGQTFYMQWLVSDPNAGDGLARSQVAAVTPFCTMTSACAPSCPADLDGNGQLDFFDVSAFVTAHGNQDPAADIDGNGELNFFDVSAFVSAFADGCP